MVEYLRFYREGRQQIFGFYLHRTTQAVSKQTDVFDVGQACGDVR